MEINQLATDSINKAMGYLEQDNPGRAFSHFLTALNLVPERKDILKMYVIQSLEEFGLKLVERGELQQYFNCFNLALDIYPDCSYLLRAIGNKLITMNEMSAACGIFEKITIIEPQDPEVQRLTNDLKNALVQRWHFRMLNDKVRNQAYKDAILRTVQPGDGVMDIGCGSGILAMFANEKNPSRTYAVEYSQGLYEVANKVFDVNEIVNITLINEASFNLQPVDCEGVSVIVTEIFDVGLFGEGVLRCLVDAWKRILKSSPSARIVPKGATLYVCGIQCDTLARKHRFVRKNNHLNDILDFGNLTIFAEPIEPYDTEDLNRFSDLKYMTNVAKILDVNFYNFIEMAALNAGKAIDKVTLKPCMDGNIDAFAVWFDLHLDDKISITTDPRAAVRANAWEQTIIHLNKERTCTANSEFSIEFSCKGGFLQLLHENSNTYAESEGFYGVPCEVVGCLNNTDFLKASENAAGAACVHLAQSKSEEFTLAVDYFPFPVIGFLLLSRRVHRLACGKKHSKKEKRLIKKLAQLNNINEGRISFKTANDYERIDIVVNNFFWSEFGELWNKYVVASRSVRIHQLGTNGIMMPYNIKMKAMLIYSSEINRVNIVDDENVCGYRIASSINAYSVTHNYIGNVNCFPYTSMSDELVVFEKCLDPLENNTIEVELVKSGPINAVLCWYDVQLIEDGITYSTASPHSHMKCTLHLLLNEVEGVAGQKVAMLVFTDVKGHVKIALDTDN